MMKLENDEGMMERAQIHWGSGARMRGATIDTDICLEQGKETAEV